MRNKKIYNNLFDSICVTLLLVGILGIYTLLLWFGVINPREGTDPIVALIVDNVLFGSMIIITKVYIIKYCYGYWVLLDDIIICKEALFSKKIKIKLSEIEKVEKKIIPAFVLGTYKSEAYMIYSGGKKNVILINGKKEKYSELDNVLANFIDENKE